MKVVKQNVMLFKDLERSNVPCHMVKNFEDSDDRLITLTLTGFGVSDKTTSYFLVYNEEAEKLSDLRALWKWEKKKNGQKCLLSK